MRRKGKSTKAAGTQPTRVRPLRMGFVLAPQFTLTAFAGFVDALRLAADEEDRSRPINCEWAVLGDPDKPVTASCGAQLQPWDAMDCPERFDYIAVVGGLLHGGKTMPRATQTFLLQAADAGVSLIGLCTGSFILARTGLLKGYECCVSWFHREDFVEEFPRLNVRTDRLFVVDRDRLTCAGGTSVVRLAAHIIDKHFGPSHAIKSLRILLEDAPLPDNAWQPDSIITRRSHDSVVRQAMLAIEQRLDEAMPLAALFRPLGIGIRQIERRFVADVGLSPNKYRLRLRLARARWMLEHTDRPVTQIGLDCGFADLSHFSRTYRNHFKVRPLLARHRARAGRPVPT